MKILFVNHHHLDSNSGIHIFNLANHLSELRIDCKVCVPEKKDAVKALGIPKFDVLEIQDLLQKKKTLEIDIIHAWTPRERVRLMTNEIVDKFGCPYIVHLEDNEESLVSAALGKSISSLNKLTSKELDEIIPPHMSHPKRYKEFLAGASGITMLIDTLKEFCPSNLPTEVIWPGYDEEINWSIPQNNLLRQQLGIGPDEWVVVYTGNVHSANRNEVFSLYLAVGLLNRKGIKTRIIRTGLNFVPLINEELKNMEDICVDLGYVKRNDLPVLLSLADVLVQPGKIDEFNNYRFPSKLPEYFATGKPVVLPATNIGRYLIDGKECVLLQEGHALEIARKLETLFLDEEFRNKIGKNGCQFANKKLLWSMSADKLLKFYNLVLNAHGSSLAYVENTYVNQDPIIIYQMGKVGSKTVESSLLQAYERIDLNVPIYHRHVLNISEGSEEELLKERANPEISLIELASGRELRKKINENPYQKWKLISLVRDPIARNVATFFQNLREFIPDWKDRLDKGKIDVDELQKLFFSIKSIHDEPKHWFDGQLKTVFGIDVFSSSFPTLKGYKIYNDVPKNPLLVIRLEDLNQIGSVALQKFLGLDNPKIISTNIGKDKLYAELYDAFKNIPMPMEYIERIYDTKFVKHFYSMSELERFSYRWMKIENEKNKKFDITGLRK